MSTDLALAVGLEPSHVQVPEPYGLSLGDLIETLGPQLLSVVVAPVGLDDHAAEPVIFDAEAPGVLRPGDVVLAVGVSPASRAAVGLVVAAGRAQAAAVVFKEAHPLHPELMEAAMSSAVAVLAVPAAAEWGHVHALVRSAGLSGRRAHRLGAGPELAIGDLFSLANAIAAMAGGSVVIHDMRFRLLAYSVQAADTDDIRRDTILGWRAPESVVEMVRRAGVLRQLQQPGAVVEVAGPEFEGLRRRLAVGVHAGEEQLGSIWVVEGDRPFDEHAWTALGQAAQMAALHLVRHMAHDDMVRRHRGEVLHDFLDGRIPAATAAPTLSLGLTASCTVLAVKLPDESEAGRDLHADRILSLVHGYAATYRLRTAQVAVGGIIYVLLEHGGGQPAAASRRLAAFLLQAVEKTAGHPIRVAIGEHVAGLTDAPASRRLADQVLRVSEELARPLPDVVAVEDVQAACILDDLRATALDRRSWVADRLRRLVEQDARRSSGYISILRAYLDSGGNMRAAAMHLGVHPNTYRYRLRRVAELLDWDLDDPDQRLVLQLQLRLGLLPLPHVSGEDA